MDADLVLEGGGMKGIALVGAVAALEDAGYRFQRVAGTSAGAIVAAMVAAGAPARDLERSMREAQYPMFRDLRHLARVPSLGRRLSFLFGTGAYAGDELKAWIGRMLARYDVATFRDLRMPTGRGGGLRERDYRLVVIASDVTNGRLVRLPWDAARYGLDPDDLRVDEAVRASTSLPFLYTPAQIGDGRSGRKAYLVDGGLLSNFPIGLFDRTDGRQPRWPTFGVKLSTRRDARPPPTRIRSRVGLALAVLNTMLVAHDRLRLDEPCVRRRTMFVDTSMARAIDFDIDAATLDALYANGRAAANEFLETWDFEAYLRACRS